MTASLSSREFDCIYSFIQSHPKVYAGTRESCHRFLSAVKWVLRSGAQWRLLPAVLGKWNSVHKRFLRWSVRGIFEQLVFSLAETQADIEWLCVDSTIVRAHMSAAGTSHKSGGQKEQQLSRSRGGFTSKLHLKTDALGNPLKLVLTGGHRNDVIGFPGLCDEKDQEASAVLADRAYDTEKIRGYLAELQVEAVIPPRTSRVGREYTYDRELYKSRSVIECSINKLKWFRRVFTRFDKRADTYLSFVYFACVFVWLR